MVLSLKNFPIKKYRGEGFLAKNAVFCYFSCPIRKKFQVAANRTILIPEGLPNAHGSSESLCPKFSEAHVEKVLIFKIVGTSPLRSQVIQNRVRQNSCF